MSTVLQQPESDSVLRGYLISKVLDVNKSSYLNKLLSKLLGDIYLHRWLSSGGDRYRRGNEALESSYINKLYLFFGFLKCRVFLCNTKFISKERGKIAEMPKRY